MKAVITSGILGLAVLLAASGSLVLGQTNVTSQQEAAWQAEMQSNILKIMPPAPTARSSMLKKHIVAAGLMATLSSPAGSPIEPAGQQSQTPPAYVVVDLGTLGGNSSEAFGINSAGQVVGESYTNGNSYEHAFLWQSGSMQDIGTLGGTYSLARGVNSSGQIVGESYTSNGNTHAFLWQNGAMQDLGTLGGNSSSGYAINSFEQIVGDAITISGLDHAFLWQNGAMQDLGTLGGNSSQAYGLNSSVQVVGISGGVGFLWQAGAMKNLGTFHGTTYSEATGINSSGQIIGDTLTDGDVFINGCLWQNGTIQDLETLGGAESHARGINSFGQIVGDAQNGGGYFHAFLWQNGTMYDLNSLMAIANAGWTLEQANAINDSGQIVGYGTNPSGQTHAFLLNPLPPGALLACTNPQTSTPSYGGLPVKEPGKDNLVVVTHGMTWTVETTNPVAYTAWIYDFSNVLSERLEADGKSDWQVFAYSWATNSYVLIPGNALTAAKAEGIQLGDCIATQGWSEVHLIGHSAGAELINVAAEEIKSISPSTLVQCTFLAPYVGSTYEEQGAYGASANWSDCYLDNDLTFGWTAQPLLFAYNADVTALDSAAEGLPSFASAVDPYEPCDSEMVPSLSGHFWPIEFYTNTVAGNTSILDWSYYGGFGYGLSLENQGDNWTTETSYFPMGNGVPFFGYGSVTNLGPQPQTPSCLSIIGGTIASAASTVAFAVESTIQSSASSVEASYGAASLIDGPPAWVATIITPTNAVNQVSFDAEFTSAPGARGLLSVYWDTNLLGLADEAEVQPGLQHYVLQFPVANAVTSHVLGFHLDPFASVSSSISMTNVMVGWAGVTQGPTLSVIGSTNGLLVFQLLGQEDNYEIQVATNLLNTSWTDMALVANTTGTAEFTDQSTTNCSARFYRAMAQ